MRHYNIRKFQWRTLPTFDTIYTWSGVILIRVFVHAPDLIIGTVYTVQKCNYFVIYVIHIGDGIHVAFATAAAYASNLVQTRGRGPTRIDVRIISGKVGAGQGLYHFAFSTRV